MRDLIVLICIVAAVWLLWLSVSTSEPAIATVSEPTRAVLGSVSTPSTTVIDGGSVEVYVEQTPEPSPTPTATPLPELPSARVIKTELTNTDTLITSKMSQDIIVKRTSDNGNVLTNWATAWSITYNAHTIVNAGIQLWGCEVDVARGESGLGVITILCDPPAVLENIPVIDVEASSIVASDEALLANIDEQVLIDMQKEASAIAVENAKQNSDFLRAARVEYERTMREWLSGEAIEDVIFSYR